MDYREQFFPSLISPRGEGKSEGGGIRAFEFA